VAFFNDVNETTDDSSRAFSFLKAFSKMNRDVFAIVLLLIGILGLVWRFRGQVTAIHQIETAPLTAAKQTYQQEIAPTIQWGAYAPEFIAFDRKSRSLRSLAAMRKGKVLFGMAFLGGKTPGNSEVAWDLAELRRQFARRGFEAMLVLEPGANKDLPSWLLRAFGGPIVEDAHGRIAQEYGLTGMPFTVLLDRTGRVDCTATGLEGTAGASWVRQEIETVLFGKVRLPRYGSLLVVDQRFPTFTAETSRGGRFDLAQPGGRWTLVVISAEGCRACGGLHETIAPQIEAIQKKGGRTLWIDLSDSVPKDADLQSNVVELYDSFGSLRSRIGKQRIPCVFLVDPSNNIRLKVVGNPKVMQLLQLTTAIDRIGAS
jgi:hypothetical protein